MNLKLDADGHVVVQDGKPVYVHADGKEIAFDAPHALATINARGTESKQHRTRAEELAAKLQGFGDLDPENARKAVETLANIDAKKLVDAGQVELLKANLTKTYEENLTAEKAKTKTAEQRYANELLGGAFARSKFIADKLAFPADIARAAFGEHFRVDNDSVVAFDRAGNPLLSRIKPGEPPAFDEAIELIVEMHPQRESLLRATQQSGSGTPTNGGGIAGAKTKTRTQFEGLGHADRMAFSKSGGRVVD